MAVVLIIAAAAAAEPDHEVAFPADAGIIDVTAPPYGATGDGVSDDRAAIQAALDAAANGNRIVFLPSGTYLVGDTLRWGAGAHGGMAQKRTILQGAGMRRTVIRLKDGAPGFAATEQPPKGVERSKAVIWTGQAPAQRFRNGIRDLTVDIGVGNPRATGIQYIANNQGSMRDVRIVAPAGQGFIGLDLGYSDEQGPCLITRVRVEGFDIGIRTAHVVDGVHLEHIHLEGQRLHGLHNDGQCVSLRRLTSRNACPALTSVGANSFLVMIEAELTGAGAEAGGVPAVVSSGYLLARDVVTRGYAHSIDSAAGGQAPPRRMPDGKVAELVSHDAYTLFPGPVGTLRLPVAETPPVPRHALTEWISPREFGGDPDDDADDTAAMQRAVDSGRKVLYLPYGAKGWRIEGTVEIRGAIEVVTGLEHRVKGGGRLRVVDGSAPVVVIERMDFLYQGVGIEHATGRDLVVSGITFGTGQLLPTGAGRLFLEDVCMGPLELRAGQRVWARGLNIESQGRTKILNDGGTLWVLGYKTEQHGTVCETRGGGATEILGGFVYAQGRPKDTPMFVVHDARCTVSMAEVCWNFGKQGYHVLARETRGGETRELAGGAAAGRHWHANGASAVPLFCARER